SEAAAFRARLGIEPAEILVLFLGRIHAYKGLDALIRAFGQVQSRDRNLRLVIAGRDDGYLSTAQNLARQVVPAGRVIFSGPLYGNDRFDAYHAADLFAITPSHFEQTSLAALEAASCGTPILVTQQAAIPGLDAAGGGCTTMYDASAVAGALQRLLNSDMPAMGARARALVRERFSLDRVTRDLERTYDMSLMRAFTR
ncbi:MAG: glycosyltransferase family 4 protein, partial [Chloroflexota bacterium]|nr:glycosyltransferase family 4 protein [Chloroflexota bacterium]